MSLDDRSRETSFCPILIFADHMFVMSPMSGGRPRKGDVFTMLNRCAVHLVNFLSNSELSSTFFYFPLFIFYFHQAWQMAPRAIKIGPPCMHADFLGQHVDERPCLSELAYRRMKGCMTDDRDQSHGCFCVNLANRGLPLAILFCEGLQNAFFSTSIRSAISSPVFANRSQGFLV